MATKNTRLYRVQSRTSPAVRLIEAATPSGARNFVSRDDYAVDIPAQHEVFAMAKAGIEIEIAGADGLSIDTRAKLAKSCIEGA